MFKKVLDYIFKYSKIRLANIEQYAMIISSRILEGDDEMARKFGYARVSSKDQNLDRQYEALLPYLDGDKDKIFAEKASGKDIEGRDVLKGLCKTLSDGDILYVVSLDRLGRNKNDIKKILEDFRKNGVSIKILDLPTTMVEARDDISAATMEMITNLLIEVLGYMAEMERRNIRVRQKQGIDVARAKGTKFGRKPKALPDTWVQDYKAWKAGKCTAVSLIKKYGWAPATFYARVKQYGKVHG